MPTFASTDEFLPDYDELSTNVFEDDFVLDQLMADDVCFSEDFLTKDIGGIKEELESWTGGSSVSSSPTFSHRTVASDSDEDKPSSVNPYDFLRDVVVDQAVKDEPSNRDTPSPGSQSSSSGCFSDFSNSACDLKGFPQSPVAAVNVINLANTPTIAPPQTHYSENVPPILFTQVPSQNGIQYVQIPSIIPSVAPVPITVQPIAPKPIQIKPKPVAGVRPTKTVVLSKEDFGQLMKKMKVTKAPAAAPTNQNIIQPSTRIIPRQSPGAKHPVTMAKPSAEVIRVKPPVSKNPIEPLIYLPNQLMDERTYKKQQRLIKNREAASTSRRKKKEYVDSLEETIQELSKEKEQLIGVGMEFKVNWGSYSMTLYYRRTIN